MVYLFLGGQDQMGKVLKDNIKTRKVLQIGFFLQEELIYREISKFGEKVNKLKNRKMVKILIKISKFNL